MKDAERCHATRHNGGAYRQRQQGNDMAGRRHHVLSGGSFIFMIGHLSNSRYLTSFRKYVLLNISIFIEKHYICSQLELP